MKIKKVQHVTLGREVVTWISRIDVNTDSEYPDGMTFTIATENGEHVNLNCDDFDNKLARRDIKSLKKLVVALNKHIENCEKAVNLITKK